MLEHQLQGGGDKKGGPASTFSSTSAYGQLLPTPPSNPVEEMIMEDTLSRGISLWRNFFKEAGNVAGDVASNFVARLDRVERSQEQVLESQARVERVIMDCSTPDSMDYEETNPEDHE